MTRITVARFQNVAALGSARYQHRRQDQQNEVAVRSLIASCRLAPGGGNYCRSTAQLTDAKSQGTKVASTVARDGKTEAISRLSYKSLKSCENPGSPANPALSLNSLIVCRFCRDVFVVRKSDVASLSCFLKLKFRGEIAIFVHVWLAVLCLGVSRAIWFVQFRCSGNIFFVS